ncbi:MAG: hypothetical protein LUG12_13750 [Erysipelotrichaceae bacterium]|nr:hypothetical protein [Erysipelotrichaceae bacterium]
MHYKSIITCYSCFEFIDNINQWYENRIAFKTIDSEWTYHEICYEIKK